MHRFLFWKKILFTRYLLKMIQNNSYNSDIYVVGYYKYLLGKVRKMGGERGRLEMRWRTRHFTLTSCAGTFHFWWFLMAIRNWLQLTSIHWTASKWCDFQIESNSPHSHFNSTATLLLYTAMTHRYGNSTAMPNSNNPLSVVFSSPVKSSFFTSKRGNWQPQPV